MVNNDMKYEVSRFMSIILCGYFGTQIMYNMMSIPRIKPYAVEIHDLTILISLTGLLYTFNGYSNGISPIFYIGFIPGLLGAYIYNKLEWYNGKDDIIWNNIKLVMYLLSGAVVLISLLASIQNGSAINHLIYILTVLIIIVLLIHTKQSQTNVAISKVPLNFGLTNTSFILLFMMQYAGIISGSSPNVITFIANICQGLVMGLFVSGISYYGISYILTDGPILKPATDKCHALLSAGVSSAGVSSVGQESKSDPLKTPSELITQRDILNDVLAIKLTTSFIISILILVIIMFNIGQA
jgi:hypothetical protein